MGESGGLQRRFDAWTVGPLEAQSRDFSGGGVHRAVLPAVLDRQSLPRHAARRRARGRHRRRAVPCCRRGWPFVDNIEPPGLYRGPVELADGRVLEGMLGQAGFVAKNGVDISGYGGWAEYPYRSPGVRIDKDPSELSFDLFVNGTLMRGLKLHANLKRAPFLGEAMTEPRYRIYSIGDVHPGMYRLEDDEDGGISVPGELYRIPEALWPELEASEPPGLYRGPVVLDDGSTVWGILYPRDLAEGNHPDITVFGGWRAYVARRESEAVRMSRTSTRRAVSVQLRAAQHSAAGHRYAARLRRAGGFGELLGNDVAPLRAGDRADRARAGGLARAWVVGDPHPRGPPPGSDAIARRPSVRAANWRSASAIRGRWGACWCAASGATILWTSYGRCQASR